MHTGGWAAKLGNRYEGRWTAKQLLRLLNGKLQAVRLENVEEEHVDVYVMNLDGTPEAHQCKRRIDLPWSIGELERRGATSALSTYLREHEQGRFVFVSNQPVNGLTRLTQSVSESHRLTDFLGSLRAGKDKECWDKWCQAVDCVNDPTKAFDLLKRTELEICGDGHRDVQNLHSFAKCIVDGEPRDVLVLADYATDHMGQWIHTDRLRHFVQRSGSFRLRDLAHSEAIAPVLEACCRQYRESISPYLVNGHLISRAETQAVFQSIMSSGKRIHIVHGSAGQGKSCVLYELTRMLEANGVPYLPVRFDSHVPRDNTRQFGNQLGFLESPVRCLASIAGDRTAILILDQLDALHWSPQHDASSWTVFPELMNEVFQWAANLRVIVACRTFDLRHDPSISAWRHDKERNFPMEETSIGDIDDESVKHLVEALGASWTGLSTRQRDLMRKPHLLYLWCKLVKGSRQNLAFQTATDLLREFWDRIRRELLERGCQQTDINCAIAALVNRLDQSGELTAPASTLQKWPGVRDGVLSLDVLHVANGKLRFVHQSYFDYYLATMWRERLRDEGKTVLDWLTANDEQSLLRRGQLRQLLDVIRDDEPALFLETVRAILGGISVRFHLRHLTVQFLGSIRDPRRVEVDLILEKLKDPAWREAVVMQVIVGRLQWFQVLDDRGVWRDWLRGFDPWQIQTACWVLHSVAEIAGDRVADLLHEFATKPPPWPARVWSTLPRRTEADSAGLFDVRLHLVRDGIQGSDFCFSAEFSQQYPERAIELLAAVLEAENAKPLTEDETNDREGWPYWFARGTSRAVRLAVDSEPARAWRTLVPRLLDALVIHRSARRSWDHKPFDSDALWNERLYRFDDDREFAALPAMLAAAGGTWLRADWVRAREALDTLSAEPPRTTQQIVGTAWLQGPDEAADVAIDWLVSDDRRFLLAHIGKDRRCGLAQDLIARFSPTCSPGTYARLESVLLRYYPPDEVGDFKDALRFYSGGERQYSANRYGSAQHLLLPAVPSARRTQRVVNAIGQLHEKYAGLAAETADGGAMGGQVMSPVSSRGARLSDEAWLQLISRNPKSERFRQRWFRDHVLESSREMFARDLWQQAEREPGRFAALALKVPNDVPGVYWGSLLRASRLTRAPDEKLTDWEPASDEQCRAVLERVGYHMDREVGLRSATVLP
jgi:hypothetical protein